MGILPPIQIKYYTTSETTSQEPPDAPLDTPDAPLDARPSPSARIPALPPAPPSMPSGYALPLGDAYGSARQARSGMRSPLRASLFCDTESSSPEGSVARGSAGQSVTSRGKGALFLGTEDGKELFLRKAFPVSEGERMESVRILQNHSQELKRRGGRSKESKISIP